jgi:hypothetical protein
MYSDITHEAAATATAGPIDISVSKTYKNTANIELKANSTSPMLSFREIPIV